MRIRAITAKVKLLWLTVQSDRVLPTVEPSENGGKQQSKRHAPIASTDDGNNGNQQWT